MTITIHRGIKQIGGCITEIKSEKGTKILINLHSSYLVFLHILGNKI